MLASGGIACKKRVETSISRPYSVAMLLALMLLQDPVLTEDGAKRIESFDPARKIVVAYRQKPSSQDLARMSAAGVDIVVVSCGAVNSAALLPLIFRFSVPLAACV